MTPRAYFQTKMQITFLLKLFKNYLTEYDKLSVFIKTNLKTSNSIFLRRFLAKCLLIKH